MKLVKRHHYLAGILLVVLALSAIWYAESRKPTPQDTTTVDKGRVEQTVVVSGIAKAKEAARLRFVDAGTIASIIVGKGAHVEKGAVLASLATGEVQSSRKQAMAALSRALADEEKLLVGLSANDRTLSSTSVENASNVLLRTTSLEDEKVKNAENILRSSDLVVVPNDPLGSDSAPTVGGSYTCDKDGAYTIEIYKSTARSGYSYTVKGLEAGTFPVYTDAPRSFGSCGLTLLFSPTTVYHTGTWTLAVPNTHGSSYLTNKNNLALAREARASAIHAAQDALHIATLTALRDSASPRSEDVAKAEAAVADATAQVARADAQMERRLIRAPFSGTVTDVIPKVGETASPDSAIMTLLSENSFEITARVPEIDIRKIHVNDSVTLSFDAAPQEQLHGSVSFISPLATQVDGVGYFDTTIELTSTSTWMREGLNADITIYTDAKSEAVRLPKRFLVTKDSQSFVHILEAGKPPYETRKIETGLAGTNGYTEVALPLGTTVIAP